MGGGCCTKAIPNCHKMHADRRTSAAAHRASERAQIHPQTHTKRERERAEAFARETSKIRKAKKTRDRSKDGFEGAVFGGRRAIYDVSSCGMISVSN